MKFFVKTDGKLIATINWDDEFAKLNIDGKTVVGPFGSLATMVLNNYPNAELVAEEDESLSKEEVVNRSKAWAKMQEDQHQAYVDDHHHDVVRMCEGHIVMPEDKELITKLAMLQVINYGLKYLNNKET
jgi:hypothetical protein